MVAISIVVPTLNEERYLPALLRSIKAQSFKDHEVVVSDSQSKDRTRQIARRFGVKVVTGPKKGPGAGRNLGARYAKGEILLFLDADTVLRNRNTLSSLYNRTRDKTVLCGGIAYLPKNPNIHEALLYLAGNLTSFFGAAINRPFTPGFCMFKRAKAFRKVGGFDEGIKWGEDIELSLRTIKKLGGKSAYVLPAAENSVRRFRTDGFLKTLDIYLKCVYYVYILGRPEKIVLKFKPASSKNF